MANLRFEMDGEWDLGDLNALASTLKITYAYFYWSGVSKEAMPQEVVSLISRYFWSGEYIGERFAERLYWNIPESDRTRLKSIEYHSPGWIEIAAASGLALNGLAIAAKNWIETGEKALDFIERVRDFFRKRNLEKIERRFSLGSIDGASLDVARAMCFEAGRMLELPDTQVENIIEITGNPISALRMLMTMAGTARNTGDLASKGKLKLSAKRRADGDE
jgi:hypothetical protein